MLGENFSYYKAQLKHSVKSGPQLVTITDVRRFLDDRGKELLFKGKHGIVIKFSNDNIEHEELFWLAGHRYVKLLKLMAALSIRTEVLSPILFLNKQLWILIRHNITIEKDVEVKREADIVKFSLEMPNHPPIYEEYDIAAI